MFGVSLFGLFMVLGVCGTSEPPLVAGVLGSVIWSSWVPGSGLWSSDGSEVLLSPGVFSR